VFAQTRTNILPTDAAQAHQLVMPATAMLSDHNKDPMRLLSGVTIPIDTYLIKNQKALLPQEPASSASEQQHLLQIK